MNKKIIIIISIMILLISVFGLVTSQENSTKKQLSDLPPAPKKVHYSFLVASRDLYSGEIINLSDITTETTLEDEGKTYDDVIINQNKDFIADSILLKNVKKGNLISHSDIARPSSTAYNNLKATPKKGLYSFGFHLAKREYSLLNKIKPNEFVDIYFKYETKNKKTIPILPKKNPNQQYSSETNASSSNLILMFATKRVLFLEKTPLKTEEKDLKSIAEIHIELSDEEIKKIYAIEDLGDFIIFPSSKNHKNTIATENILTKDFIKELRGGADAKSDSY